jgi:hypothetical protein
MIEIKISNRKFMVTFIDEDDFTRVTSVSPEWQVSGCGYPYVCRRIFNESKAVYLHKFIVGAQPHEYVDHINRNKLDNRKSNLRICTQSQNLVNWKKDPTGKTSKHKGVCWNKRRQKWVVRVNFKKREILGGGFTSEIEAAKKANELYIKYYGEFACLNEIT